MAPKKTSIVVELSASDTIDVGEAFSGGFVMLNTSDDLLKLESRCPDLAVPRVERVDEPGVRVDISPGYFCPGRSQTHWFGPGERQVIEWEFEASLLSGDDLTPGDYRLFAIPQIEGLADDRVDFQVR